MTRSAQTLMLALLLATGVGYSSSGTAQSSGAKPGVEDDLRAANASSQDVAEGKRLADATCARCHGAKGISSSKGVPHIAGQRPAYLHLELRAYQTGTRGNTPMEAAVKFLSDDALVKVAAYYASLDPATPSNTKPAPAKPDPVQAGKAAASGCAGCHGEGGISKTGGVPSLIGQDPKFLISAMQAYKSGQRKNDMMKTLLAAVTETEMGNIALYYALQKPAKAATPAAGDKAAGKAAAADCGGCHGDLGVSGSPATPSLAGQDAEYLVDALKAYKSGARSDDTMKSLAAALDEKNMKNIAAYYNSLQPQPPKAKKPLSTAEWVQRCDRCHGVNGNSTDPRLPALAAQRADYMDKVLRSYQKGERKNTSMAAMSTGLSDAEIENLSSYYAQQKARSVVFITQPGK